jgi:hypothetical protein
MRQWLEGNNGWDSENNSGRAKHRKDWTDERVISERIVMRNQRAAVEEWMTDARK